MSHFIGIGIFCIGLKGTDQNVVIQLYSLLKGLIKKH